MPEHADRFHGQLDTPQVAAHHLAVPQQTITPVSLALCLLWCLSRKVFHAYWTLPYVFSPIN
jgi:hypothetical protein